MKNTKGFGVIEIVVAIVIVAILAGAGYVLMQSLQRDNQTNPTEQSNQGSQDHHDHQTMAGWEEYQFDQYGLTFHHPADWQVEVATVEGFENQPNILIKDGNNALVLGIYGYRGDDDGCDMPAYDLADQPNLKIGQYPATVLGTCSDVENWIGVNMTSNDNHLLAITTNFLGQPQENQARMLLESMTGLMPAIIN